jgi:hypothetical protein
MSTTSTDKPATSLYSRLIARRRPLWVTVGIGLALILLPLAAAYLDGALGDIIGHGFWRQLLLPFAVILYILLVAPILERMAAGVIDAFRPLVLIDDGEFDHLVAEASRLNPLVEILSCAAGMAFGLWIGHGWFAGTGAYWLNIYSTLAAGLMFGLLTWTIYVVLGGTRLTAALHRPPLRIDIFDIRPFEPIGRQSLIAALAFVGGIVLGVVFGFGPGSIYYWQNWVVIFVLALVPILLFFLSMRDTHRVLAAEKQRHMADIEDKILRACHRLLESIEGGEDTSGPAAEINALATYEERVRAARTWPYNTRMLRTLLFSVVIPGATALARLAAELM